MTPKPYSLQESAKSILLYFLNDILVFSGINNLTRFSVGDRTDASAAKFFLANHLGKAASTPVIIILIYCVQQPAQANIFSNFI